MFEYKHEGQVYSLFFVLKGLINGFDGEYAQRSGTGAKMDDGWYYLFGGDPDGVGPYDHREEAQRYAKAAIEAAKMDRAEGALINFLAGLKNNNGLTNPQIRDMVASALENYL